ncbi:MAG: CHAT domain-containing protein [Saprospiraceae bacterium]|nr:CHAT domain-containing protein [Saprospiraceae bacterium]
MIKFSCYSIMFCIFWNIQLYAQPDINCQKDSIISEIKSSLKTQNLKIYFTSVRDLEDLYIKFNYIDSIYSTDKWYNLKVSNNADSFELRKAYMNHALKIRRNLGDYNTALNYYLLAHDYASDKLMLDEYAWFVELQLGNIYARMNEYDKSLYYYNLCSNYLKSVEDIARLSRLHSSIGDIYKWTDDENNMNDNYMTGLKLAIQVGEYKAIQAIHEKMAEHFLSKSDKINFLDNWNKSMNVLKKNIPAEEQNGRKNSLDQLLGDYYYTFGNYDDAIRNYNLSLSASEVLFTGKISREQAKIYHKLAKTYHAAGDTKNCDENIQFGFSKLIPSYHGKQLPGNEQISFENTFTDLLILKSEYYSKLYKKQPATKYLDSALISIDLAIMANDQLDQKLLLNNSKYQSLKVNKDMVELAIQYCYTGYNEYCENKYLHRARKYLDRSKSQILLENQKQKQLIASIDQKDLRIINNLENKLIDLQQKQLEGKEGVHQEIILNHQKLDAILKKYIPENLEYVSVSDPYLEYIRGGDQYYLYTNIGESKFINLGKSEKIDAIIKDVNLHLNEKKEEQLSEKLALLYETLIPLDLGEEKVLVVIPDGNVSFVPFDILRKRGKYLFETKTLRIQLNHQQLKHNKTKKTHQIYCLNPEYPKPEVPLYASLERGSKNYLPNAEREILNIKDCFGRMVSSQSFSSINDIKTNLQKSDIFHFAGHAIVEKDSAYLVLTSKEGKEDVLHYQQICYLTNQLNLVTLSACETGLGTYQSGEGVKSLAASFLHSGARSIVYSLWNANDASTATLMGYFYQNLKEGMQKDEALNHAKKMYLNSAGPENRHPYYWAAFVVAGDTSALTFVDYPLWTYALLLFVFIVLIYIYFKIKTKRK